MTSARSRVRVLTLNAALGPLDYRLPHGMTAEPGSIVVAPLGPRQVLGVVWEDEGFPGTETVGDNRLRPLLDVIDVAAIGAPLRRLVEWTADYYLAPPAAVLRMALASIPALEGARTVVEYRATGRDPARSTPKRAQALERIGDRQGLVRELAMIGGVSDAVIRGLVKDGALEAVEVSTDTPFAEPDPDFAPVDLAGEQSAAAARLVELTRAGAFQPLLLDGVTGSGKTEVYFEAIAEALRTGKQTVVLLPEIALTEPFLARFAARFGCEPIAWHSGLRQSERRRAWRAIANGTARVVVGARSALFLPYARLGLIVVDEAHEASFKQEDGVRYHARDVAVMRGKMEQCPVVLASATPAIETRHQVALGRYEEIRLPARYGSAEMPEIIGIDLTQHPPDRGRWIAPPLVKAMTETLERGEQALLFLNRRGYAFPVPQLHELDGRASPHPSPRLPSLRPHHTRAQGMPGMPCRRQPRRLRPRRRAHRRRGRRAVPAGAHRHRHLRHALVARQGRRIRARCRGRRGRYHRRHPACHQGLSFSQSDPRRRDRRRSRPGRRRPARG
jgi:primosomal protein N' (replication factor Y)